MAQSHFNFPNWKQRADAVDRFYGVEQPWEKPGLSRAQRVITFCEQLTVSTGETAGEKLKLRPFQKQFIRDVYRTDQDGRRPVRTAIFSMGRKNGKTQLAAALALAHLCGPEAEERGEIYSCANDRFQASKIYNEMLAMIRRHEMLTAFCTSSYHIKEITDLKTESIYNALSRDARTKMGLNPSMVVYDELGQAPDRSLYDAMDTAFGARKDPLLMVISTQAADDFAPLSMLIDYGLRVKRGEVVDPTFHLALYSTDITDDPWDERVWKKANPALGMFRSLADIKRQADQAQKMPALENKFRNLILNQRVAAEARFIEPTAWQACGNPAQIPGGVKVYAGLDLGYTRDLSALVLLWQDSYQQFHVQPYFWLPGDIHARTDEERVPYDAWQRAGMIEAIGESTDPARIARKIAELNGQYRIIGLAFDRWRINDLKRELNQIGCTVPLVEHGQGFKEMSPAVDIVERMIVQKRLRHGNHPVLTWNAQNCVVTKDAAGGRKLDKAKSIGRIDGMVALAMAFTLAQLKIDPTFDVSALIG